MTGKTNPLINIPLVTSLGFKIVITGIIAVLIGISLFWNLSLINQQMIERAIHEARGVFSLIATAREWNSLHGGVYVEVSDITKPNQYLNVPDRDLTINNKQYTKMNPAFMTRQIGELTKSRNKTIVNITSLTPLNPANKADDWEYIALQQFNEGAEEYYQFFTSPNENIFRYAAPLYLEESCRQCHANEEDNPESLRGAITITMPGKPLVAMVLPQKKLLTSFHLIGFFIFAGLNWFFLSQLKQNWQEKQQVEAELKMSQKSLQTVFDSIHDAVFIHDPEGTILDVNETMLKIYGIQRSELSTFPLISDYFGILQVNKNYFDLLLQVLKGDGEMIECKARCPQNGKEFYGEIFMQPICWNKKQCVLVTVRDITQRKEYEQQIEYQAYHDTLTGLPNRKFFEGIFTLTIKQEERNKTRLGVMFLDVDGFKGVNDTFGHQVGDELLIEVARRLTSVLRSGDVVARFGGDEFLVLLKPIVELQELSTIAERILDVIRQPYTINSHVISITTSIGVSVYPYDGENYSALIQKADKALYQSKEKGRNKWTMFS